MRKTKFALRKAYFYSFNSGAFSNIKKVMIVSQSKHKTHSTTGLTSYTSLFFITFSTSFRVNFSWLITILSKFCGGKKSFYGNISSLNALSHDLSPLKSYYIFSSGWNVEQIWKVVIMIITRNIKQQLSLYINDELRSCNDNNFWVIMKLTKI